MIRFLVLALLLPFACNIAAQTTQDFEDEIQKMYIAYYGRPGDDGGVVYWSGQLAEAGGSLTAVIDAFGNSAEFQERFGDLDNEALVENIYLQLLGRSADPAGLEFYANSLADGTRTLGTIALDIANGAQAGTDDYLLIQNKLTISREFTQAVLEANLRYSLEEIIYARQLLDVVTSLESSLQLARDLLQTTLPLFPEIDGDDGGRNGDDQQSGIVDAGNGNCVTPSLPDEGTSWTLQITSELEGAEGLEITETLTYLEVTETKVRSELIGVTEFPPNPLAPNGSTDTSTAETTVYYETRDDAFLQTRFDAEFETSSTSPVQPAFVSMQSTEYSPSLYTLPKTVCEGMTYYSAPVTATATGSQTVAGVTTSLDGEYQTDATNYEVESVDEQINVPAGTFTTVRTRLTSGGASQYVINWITTDGLFVKSEGYDGNDTLLSTSVLIEFTR